MKVFGIQIGKGDPQSTANKEKLNVVQSLKRQSKQLGQRILRYQATIIFLAVAGLLALTAVRMLRYSSPPINDARVQQNIAKYQKTRIDPKIVQKIKALQSGGGTSTPNIQNGRTNPFSE